MIQLWRRLAFDTETWLAEQGHETLLDIDLGRPNGPVAEALLAHGIITKPWKDPGFETFLRVSVGSAAEVERFVQALTAIFEATA